MRFIVLAIMLLVSHAAAAEKLRVARSEATTFAFALLDLGMAEGIFARHGLEIESFDLAGAAKAHQALVAGSVDVELGSGLELLFIAKGSPAKGVAVLAGPPAGMGLMIRADGEIGDLAALKGKAIGVSTAGSLTDWLASELARRQGWGGTASRASRSGRRTRSPRRSWRRISTPSSAERKPAIASRRAAAARCSRPSAMWCPTSSPT